MVFPGVGTIVKIAAVQVLAATCGIAVHLNEAVPSGMDLERAGGLSPGEETRATRGQSGRRRKGGNPSPKSQLDQPA